MSRLTVLQCFPQYLSTYQNWAYRLLRNMPDCDQVIASRQFLNNDFYDPAFTFLELPLPRLDGEAPLGFARRVLTKAWYPAHVRRALRNRRVDVVHSHFAPTGWEYRALARQLGAPHAVSFYGFDYEQLPHQAPVWKERYRELFAAADLFICEGSHAATLLARLGCPQGKIAVNRLGIEIERTPRFARTKRPGELKLLQVARFVEKKGHVYALRAFARALPACPNMTLAFVGGGVAEALLPEARALGVADRVTFHAPVAFDAVHEFMKDYDVFIHPSCYAQDRDCEGGAPVVLIDAQGTGMPAISTVHCDIPDVVLDGKTGLLVPEKDVDALAAAIARFYALDGEGHARFAAAARAHVERDYDARRNAVELRVMLAALSRMPPG